MHRASTRPVEPQAHRAERRPRRGGWAAAVGTAAALVLGACTSTAPPSAAPPGSAAGTTIAAPSAAPGGTGAPATSAGTTPSSKAPATATPTTEVPAGDALAAPTVVTTGLAVPWGIAFLPDGAALVPERDTARILKIPAGAAPGTAATEVMTVDGAQRNGEGGLLGLAVSPTYATDSFIYAYYSGADDNRIVRFTIGGPQQVLVKGIKKAQNHDGGRLAFGPDGKLYATTGDAGDGPLAQDKASLNGKILRVEPDGSVPSDNPFPGSPVYSYGHRNVQGITWDPSGRMWSAEFGQNTWDELNLITPGGNYGWPTVEGKGGADQGFIDPKVVWATKDASPSGIAYWHGQLYIGALQGQCLWQVPIDGDGNTGDPVRLATGHGRLRTPIVAKDDSLWVSTSNTDGRGTPQPGDDQILRFT